MTVIGKHWIHKLAILFSVSILAVGCDAPVVESPAQQIAPLEEAPAEDASDVHSDSTEPGADFVVDELTFDEQVGRLMAESDAFRNAMASIQIVDLNHPLIWPQVK